MSREVFASVRTEGALLPPDLLQRVAAGDRRLGGLDPAAYGLAEGERLHERIASAWSRITGTWAAFKPRRDALADPDVGHTITRERWLLPLFEELGFGRLTAAPRALTIGDRTYAIYASWQERVPIHLVGCKVDMDRRQAGVVGAAAASPHGLLQELLNRDEHSLWGVVSNGLRLRLLRDSVKLSRQAFVEFDLESMMEGEVYSDFALLWLLCHRTRFEAERPVECWLERWSSAAAEEGARALDQLRGGVEQAIVELGRGFLEHRANGGLVAYLESGALTPGDYYRQLLRLVYRLIFLFVAEDRELLLDPAPEAAAARERYGKHYSARRVRRLAGVRRGTRHGDLWSALTLVMEKLDDPAGCAELALKPLGSFLWSCEAVPDLAGASLSNASLLAAVRALAYSQRGGSLRPVDYRNLGAEELGSVYESLLELHPRVDTTARGFALDVAAGSERKTTGSYYTPTSLIQCLLDSALDPVVDAALECAAGGGAAAQERALLDLKICDPACGSGHFLIAAAHRLARRLAQVRTGDAEPSPDAQRSALRAVIGRCLYGVDLNPMAVELCKVSLWLEALEPGKPLSFLEHHILCGNSLLGATPELIAKGLPDEAFDPLEGDDRKLCQELKKRNKRERAGQATFAFGGGEVGVPTGLAQAAAAIDAGGDATLDAVRRRERAWRGWVGSPTVARAHEVADAWCAAFAWVRQPTAPPPVTTDTVRQLAQAPESIADVTRIEIRILATQYRFFHWYLAFPEAFAQGGFNCVLGNPPWVSYTGRQQVVVSDRFLRLFLARFPSVSRWPASHPAFALLSTQLLVTAGRAGLVLPRQVADLAAYAGTREVVTAVARLASPVLDAGEHSFPGVTQPVGLFSLVKEGEFVTGSQDAWPLEVDPTTRSQPHTGGTAVTVAGDLPDLLALLTSHPSFLPRTFADPGVHTGNVSKKIILDAIQPPREGYAPIREGRDIAAYFCSPPKKWLWTDPVLEEEEYCTIRAASRYIGVPILVRQTANRPIAARHRDPTYFRNSLLACLGVSGVRDTVVVAFLNSALYALLHRAAVRDAGQKAFPQVKVRHLHSLPAIPSDALNRVVNGHLVHEAIDIAVLEAEAVAAQNEDPSPDLLERIERMVLVAFGLPPELAPSLLDAIE